MQTVSSTHPLANTRTFTLDLRGTPVEIEAAITGASAEIIRATAPDGASFSVTCSDLDTIEAALFEETPVEALDFTLGRREQFQVRHMGDLIAAIFTASGALVPPSGEQFTETAEAFHIDREYAEAVESDQPRAAARAGFLFPTHPIPTQQGIGYRRAA